MKTQRVVRVVWRRIGFSVLMGAGLTLASCAFSQTNKPAAPATAATVSPGLVNDWLRKQSPGFKAWDIGGQFRLRYEDKENAGSFPNNDFIRRGVTNSNDYLLLREKIHLGWTPESWAKFYVEGRNATDDFDQRSPRPDADKFDLQQAYVSLGDAKKFPLILKVGRQELLYGDERFVGIGDWGNVGRAFDAAKLRFENDYFWVDAFAGHVVMVDNNHFNEDNDSDWFSGVYASTKKLITWQDTQFYFLSRNVGPGSSKIVTTTGSGPAPLDIYTVGTLWKSLPGKLGGWDYSLEAAAQFGSINSTNPGTSIGLRHDLSAFGVFVSGGYTWTKAWGTPRLGVGYDYGSGDDNSGDQNTHTFQNLFGTAHKFYGQMDFFGLRNTSTPRLSASLKPFKGLTLSADYLLFWLADTHDSLYPETAAARSRNGYGIHSGFDSYAGSELDVVASYAVKTYADLQVGYGHFFVGDYIQQSVNPVPANGGTTDADWCYVQLRFNF